ncbi:hypothetical protein [Botrimarina sp.]|uniref:hypothetical protein n=1 Tax=Botrimarina sp. TaxID=2795802 RepID=UPI0032EA9F19
MAGFDVAVIVGGGAPALNLAARLIDERTPLSRPVDSPLACPTAGAQRQDALRSSLERKP